MTTFKNPKCIKHLSAEYIYQNLNSMYRLKNDNLPKILTELIKKPKYKYLTNYLKNTYTSK